MRPSAPLPPPVPRSPSKARARNVRALAAALVLLAILVGVAPGAVSPIRAQSPGGLPSTQRQGLRIRFAAIDGQSGLNGNAFLLFSSRRISLDAAPRSSCGGAHVVRAEARGSRGLVRKVALTLHLQGAGEAQVRADGCPRAELRAELEDGTELTGGEGSVVIQEANLTSGGTVSATYSWTATRGGAPFPMRGELTFTLP
ncbi:MAG: hypothetical protein H6725_03320 [Sandaracinaceae bacterium]|nr:hypothetical protein [Sandaracinaceae bacterium]